jgi:2-phospho-L-lactate/phosphoenolpyruvate guanylyltransferase
VTVARTGVVIPIRAFAMGKARLADTLDIDARADLGRRCADRVAAAAAGLPTVVVSSDPDVHSWATAHGVAVLEDPGTLDDAAAAGRSALREQGCTRVVIAHADLPHVRTFARVVRDGSLPIVVVVPCHRDDGTPVLSLPADADFRFAYGPGSARRHVAEGRRLGLGVRVVRDRALGFDIDVPADLVGLGVDLLDAPAG